MTDGHDEDTAMSTKTKQNTAREWDVNLTSSSSQATPSPLATTEPSEKRGWTSSETQLEDEDDALQPPCKRQRVTRDLDEEERRSIIPTSQRTRGSVHSSSINNNTNTNRPHSLRRSFLALPRELQVLIFRFLPTDQRTVTNVGLTSRSWLRLYGQTRIMLPAEINPRALPFWLSISTELRAIQMPSMAADVDFQTVSSPVPLFHMLRKRSSFSANPSPSPSPSPLSSPFQFSSWVWRPVPRPLPLPSFVIPAVIVSPPPEDLDHIETELTDATPPLAASSSSSSSNMIDTDDQPESPDPLTLDNRPARSLSHPGLSSIQSKTVLSVSRMKDMIKNFQMVSTISPLPSGMLLCPPPMVNPLLEDEKEENISQITSHNLGLRRIEFNNCYTITPGALATHLSKFKRLEEIRVSSSLFLLDNDVKCFSVLKNLKRIELVGCFSLTDNVLNFLKSFPHLHHLNLSGSTISGTNFHLLPPLQTLVLDETYITHEALPHIANNKGLKRLSFTNCNNISNSHLHLLESLVLLEHLSLPNCGDTVNQSDLHFLTKLTRLRSLKLVSRSSQLTWPQLIELIGNHSNLSELSFPLKLTPTLRPSSSSSLSSAPSSSQTTTTTMTMMMMIQDDEDDQDLPPVFSALRSVLLVGNPGPAAFVQLSSCERLHTLRFQDCANLTDADVALLAPLNNLEHLAFPFSNKIFTDETLNVLNAHCPRLVSLQMTVSSVMTPSAWAAFVHSHPSLQRLRLLGASPSIQSIVQNFLPVSSLP